MTSIAPTAAATRNDATCTDLSSASSAAKWNRLSLLAAGFAAAALVGRIAAFATSGPSSTVYMMGLLGCAAAALACAKRREAKAPFVSFPERRVVRIATRIAKVQTLVGVVLLAGAA